jgi:hypothetical protein
VADVITGQLQGTFASNSGLGIVRERGEAVEFLEYSPIEVGGIVIFTFQEARSFLEGLPRSWSSMSSFSKFRTCFAGEAGEIFAPIGPSRTASGRMPAP